ncbi:MAG: Abi-alpha family protein [Eubacteriales bacterium]
MRHFVLQVEGSSCNSTVSGSVHPAFPEIIKQLSPADATFIQHFKAFPTFPCAEIY